MKHLSLPLLVLMLFAASFAQTKTPPRRMAVTIDDLPYIRIGEVEYLPNASRATKKILSALRKHNAPAIGFVNEGHLTNSAERNGRIALLRQWVKANLMLGNHTYSHPDFNQLTIEQFEEEIAKGDVVTRALMRSREPYQLYFRHPMTHTGDTQEKKEAIEKFLASRGYKVTPHTIENSDFIFNVGYARALQKKDFALARRIRDAYMDLTMGATAFAEKLSPKIFGHEIPQTLLIHVNDINADCLDEMLSRFAARGYRFVSLDEVMSDPAYQTRDTTVTKYGPSWLWRWSRSMGMKIDIDTTEDPEPPQWVLDLYNQK
jgi:peptidoglycan/xylan/chitin deacetylase (PgdA/CDA1 family)